MTYQFELSNFILKAGWRLLQKMPPSLSKPTKNKGEEIMSAQKDSCLRKIQNSNESKAVKAAFSASVIMDSCSLPTVIHEETEDEENDTFEVGISPSSEFQNSAAAALFDTKTNSTP